MSEVLAPVAAVDWSWTPGRWPSSGSWSSSRPRSPTSGRGRRTGGRRGSFLAWSGARGLSLRAIAPLHVAAYIRTHPGVGAEP